MDKQWDRGGLKVSLLWTKPPPTLLTHSFAISLHIWIKRLCLVHSWVKLPVHSCVPLLVSGVQTQHALSSSSGWITSSEYYRTVASFFFPHCWLVHSLRLLGTSVSINKATVQTCLRVSRLHILLRLASFASLRKQ